MPLKKKPVLIPTASLTDGELMRLFDKRYPKTVRKMGIGYLKNHDKPLYYELRKRKLVLEALMNERKWPEE